MVEIYTDGSSIGNPGPGGYGIVMQWKGKNYKKEFYNGYRHTTNNRMELIAVIKALEKLKKINQEVVIFSDSRYVIDAVEKKWVFKWKKTKFKGKKNSDLWIKFLKLFEIHNIKFKWVKAHNNHPQNERCDFLANNAAKGDNLIIDKYFENNVL